MKRNAQIFALLGAAIVFVGMPVAFYIIGDVPRRTLLKEAISIVTLLAFTMMIGQFFLARSNTTLLTLFKPPQIQKVHKYIAYSALGVMLVHPALIVLPRFFEGGVKPWDAFVTMITNFGSLGTVLGLVAWGVMVVLGVTVFFRKKLIPHFSARYRGWRYFHGGLAVSFTVIALWHAIALGRHTGILMSVFFITLVVLGFAMLAKLYWGQAPANPLPQGAAS